MATEMINIKLEKKFLGEIDAIVEKNNYQSRTEFIRESLRKNIDESKLKEARVLLAGFRGKFKKAKQTTDEELEQIRKEASEEFLRKFR